MSVQHGIQLQGHILLQCLLDEPGMHFSYIRLLWIMLLYGTGNVIFIYRYIAAKFSVTLGRLLLIETDTVNLTVDDFKHADLLSIGMFERG